MQVPIVEEPPVDEPVRKNSRPGLIAAIAAGGVVLAAVLVMLVWGIILKSGDTIYLNVYVTGINVGGMNTAEAIDAVDEAVAASYSSATLNVQLPDRTLSFHPEQTNVALDAEEAIAEAVSHGRSGNPFSALFSFFSAVSRM